MVPYLTGAAAAAIAIAVAWVRHRFRIATVDGESMAPTLAPGDRLLVRRVPLARVRAGDVVAIGGVADADWIIKRAVALPGDPVPAAVAPRLGVAAGSPVREGAFIALGDNPPGSMDSRSFGYVPAEQLLGVVIRRLRSRPVEVSSG